MTISAERTQYTFADILTWDEGKRAEIGRAHV